MEKRLFYVVLLGSLLACGRTQKTASDTSSANLHDRANQLSHQYIIADGHVDLPYRLHEHMEDVSVQTPDGHFDAVRARQGGLDAPFMSIYIPASYEDHGAMALAKELIGSVETLCRQHPDKFARANSPADIRQNFKKGLISFPMGLENGAPVERKLSNLDTLYKLGIRYITLTHSKDNHISDSSYDQRYSNGGLSDFGYEVIRRMNKLGIMVDVAHVSDSAFYQAVRSSAAPVIASHSSCRYFTPGFERNVSDEMIKLIAAHDGLVMINFGSSFLTEQANNAYSDIYRKIMAGADENDPKLKNLIDSLKNEPAIRGTVSTVADHIDHVVKLVGVDYVGLGSDFDGVESVPIGLDDVSKYPTLIEELLKRGYTDQDIQKICSGNLFRVWNKVIDVAQSKGA